MCKEMPQKHQKQEQVSTTYWVAKREDWDMGLLVYGPRQRIDARNEVLGI